MQIPKSKPDPSKADPAVGISKAQFSATGRYLVSFNASQSRAVWLWDVQALSLACVLLHERPVRHIALDPVEDRLAMCTGSRRCGAAGVGIVCNIRIRYPVLVRQRGHSLQCVTEYLRYRSAPHACAVVLVHMFLLVVEPANTCSGWV